MKAPKHLSTGDCQGDCSCSKRFHTNLYFYLVLCIYQNSSHAKLSKIFDVIIIGSLIVDNKN